MSQHHVDITSDSDPAQHCFVSSDCESLNGGSHINQLLSKKMCVRGEDSMLSEMQPEEVQAFAKKHDLDIGLVVKEAYRTMSSLDGIMAWSHLSKSKLQQRRVRRSLGDAKAIVVDSDDGHPPFGVCSGYTNAPCSRESGFANDDIYYLEICLFAMICR